MQAKCKCQSGSISILARSRALAWLALARESSGDLLWLSCPPSYSQTTGTSLKPLPSLSASGACVGPLGWWESKQRALRCWWDREGFPERNPPNGLGKGRVEDVLQAYARRSLRGSGALPSRPRSKRGCATVSLLKDHRVAADTRFPGSRAWNPPPLPAAGRAAGHKSQGGKTDSAADGLPEAGEPLGASSRCCRAPRRLSQPHLVPCRGKGSVPGLFPSPNPALVIPLLCFTQTASRWKPAEVLGRCHGSLSGAALPLSRSSVGTRRFSHFKETVDEHLALTASITHYGKLVVDALFISVIRLWCNSKPASAPQGHVVKNPRWPS